MGFFKNYRVYMLTTVAYMGSLLFGKLLFLILTLAELKTITNSYSPNRL